MSRAGIGSSYDDAATAELHAAELTRQQARHEEQRLRRDQANSREVRAFRTFEQAVNRTAGFAAASVVYESDFVAPLDLLDESLATPRRVETVLTDRERAALLKACVDFASAFATGGEREAHGPFRAALARVQAEVLSRLDSTTAR